MKQKSCSKYTLLPGIFFISGLYVKGGNFSCNRLTFMGHNVTGLCITVRNICLQKASGTWFLIPLTLWLLNLADWCVIHNPLQGRYVLNLLYLMYIIDKKLLNNSLITQSRHVLHSCVALSCLNLWRVKPLWHLELVFPHNWYQRTCY